MVPEQLVLPVGLRDGSTLTTFLASASPQAFAAVRELVEGRQPFVYLCGPPGTGRTHLLEAAVDQLARHGEAVACISLGVPERPGPAVLEGLGDHFALVCIDDIDGIAGDRGWETGLFHLFNDLRGRRARLLVAAADLPTRLAWCLPDLASRLASGLVVGMPALDDDARLQVLVHRASCRGLELPPDTARWLLSRVSRRLDDLIALLAELDRAAWVHQRRLTLPFVREALAARGGLNDR